MLFLCLLWRFLLEFFHKCFCWIFCPKMVCRLRNWSAAWLQGCKQNVFGIIWHKHQWIYILYTFQPSNKWSKLCKIKWKIRFFVEIRPWMRTSEFCVCPPPPSVRKCPLFVDPHPLLCCVLPLCMAAKSQIARRSYEILARSHFGKFISLLDVSKYLNGRKLDAGRYCDVHVLFRLCVLS